MTCKQASEYFKRALLCLDKEEELGKKTGDRAGQGVTHHFKKPDKSRKRAVKWHRLCSHALVTLKGTSKQHAIQSRLVMICAFRPWCSLTALHILEVNDFVYHGRLALKSQARTR